jgi:hypothetical protein
MLRSEREDGKEKKKEIFGGFFKGKTKYKQKTDHKNKGDSSPEGSDKKPLSKSLPKEKHSKIVPPGIEPSSEGKPKRQRTGSKLMPGKRFVTSDGKEVFFLFDLSDMTGRTKRFFGEQTLRPGIVRFYSAFCVVVRSPKKRVLEGSR